MANVIKINAGELRTPIQIKSAVISKNKNGVQKKEYQNIFDNDAYIRCKWVNAHGNEIYTASTTNERETATITMRYSPLVNSSCVIFKNNDNKQWEITSIDNVRDMNTWLVIKIQRVG